MAYTTRFLDSPLQWVAHNSERRALERTGTDTWVKGYIRHMGETWVTNTIMNGIVQVDRTSCLVMALELSLSWMISVAERVSLGFGNKKDGRKRSRASASGTGKHEVASLIDNPHAHP